MSDKIRDEHLRRGATIYIRQSTPTQLTENRESQRRQPIAASRTARRVNRGIARSQAPKVPNRNDYAAGLCGERRAPCPRRTARKRKTKKKACQGRRFRVTYRSVCDNLPTRLAVAPCLEWDTLLFVQRAFRLGIRARNLDCMHFKGRTATVVKSSATPNGSPPTGHRAAPRSNSPR
jgi:hypothetical protein